MKKIWRGSGIGRLMSPAPLLAVLCACAVPGAYVVSPALRAVPDGRIVLLPFENFSNDVSAPGLIREEASKRFSARGYAPFDLGETDDRLRTLGVTDGGQLASVKPSELGAAFGADLLCYGTLEDFTFQNLGFIIRKQVSLRLRIVSASTGETLFEAEGQGKDLKFYLDKEEAKRAFLVNSALKLAQNMLKHPLWPETGAALGKVFDRLPAR
ncbi:MAG: GNA1162 family protein [Elusimicrobiales bacterium]|jgi:hypothetical protein